MSTYAHVVVEQTREGAYLSMSAYKNESSKLSNIGCITCELGEIVFVTLHLENMSVKCIVTSSTPTI